MKTLKFKVKIDKMLSMYEINEEKAEVLEDKIKNNINLTTLPYLFEDFLHREENIINQITYYDLWAYALYTKDHQEWILENVNQLKKEDAYKFKNMIKSLFEDLKKGNELGDFSGLEDEESPYKIIESFYNELNNIKKTYN